VCATIVLADDETDLRSIYAEVLRRDGYEVFEAADGREALDQVALHRPDLLLLDVWMPHVNGFEVLDRLRHDPHATTLKVVMLSNLGDAETRLEGFSAGICDYWTKGLSVDDLCRRVRETLASAPVGADPVGDPA
jgi:DNA-binding response OmpR family regulator